MDDLIAVPRYGWLYRVLLACGHHVLTGEPFIQQAVTCPRCGRTPFWVSWETIRRA